MQRNKIPAKKNLKTGSLIWNLQTDKVYPTENLHKVNPLTRYFCEISCFCHHLLFLPGDLEKFKAKIKKISSGKKIKQTLLNVIKPDGEKQTLEFNFDYITNASGKPEQCVINIHDVSINKNDNSKDDIYNENSNADSNNSNVFQRKKYEKILSLFPHGIWEIDNNGKTLFVNKKIEELLGYSKSEILGKHVYDFFSPKIISELKKKAEKIKQGDYVSGSTNLEHKTGKNISIMYKVFPFTNEMGKYFGALSIIAETQTQNKNEFFDMIINNSPDPIFIFKDNAFVFVSPVFEKITGYDKNVILNKDLKSLKRLTHPNDFEELSKKMQTEIENKVNQSSHIYRIKKKNGNYFWVQGLVSRQFNDEGKHKFTLIIQRDILNMKQSEKVKDRIISELEDRNAELKKLTKMKNKFVAMVSHDLRSPLGSILGMSELLVNQTDLDEEQRDIINLIMRAGQSQLKNVDSLLTLMKLDSGKIKLNLEQHSVSDFINHSINELKGLANKKDIKIIYTEECNEECREVEIDYEQMARVINNLLSNAIKFSAHGSKIELTCCYNENNTVEIHVIDYGVGIENDKLDSIFDEFY